jgi:hypothetical protein
MVYEPVDREGEKKEDMIEEESRQGGGAADGASPILLSTSLNPSTLCHRCFVIETVQGQKQYGFEFVCAKNIYPRFECLRGASRVVMRKL